MHDGGAALLLALYILSSKLMLVKMWTVLILKRCQMYLKHEFLFFLLFRWENGRRYDIYECVLSTKNEINNIIIFLCDL